MVQSGLIGQILPEIKKTWKNKCFLTIDVDWAHDKVLADTINLVEYYDVSATWFITHDTPLLSRLRENPNQELGIHPNFNKLLAGDKSNGNNEREIVERLQTIVPEACCVRSHSMMQSGPLLELFSEVGLTHDANHFIPASSKMPLKPWRLWNGITKIPYDWEDDLHCLYQQQEWGEPAVNKILNQPGMHVFDFHPIHIFLNTTTIAHYEETRDLHFSPDQLLEHRGKVKGARTWFIEVISKLSKTRPESQLSMGLK